MDRPVLPRLPGAAIPAAVSKEAARWLIALDAPAVTPQTRERWQSWLQAHPDHARAWHHLQEMGLCLRQLPPAITRSTLVDADLTGQKNRRLAIKLLTLGTLTAGGLWLARDQTAWQQADYRTATGQRQRITLADGSEVMLNTGSALNVRFDDVRRLLQLLHGEILVSTAADPQRPFLVDTPQGMLRALGTRFLVRQQARLCTVSVLEGAVEVQPNAGRPVVIEAGKQARFSDEQIVATGDNDPAAGAWSKGMLIVHRMPLAEFAAELARYRPGHLGCADAVANLPVSGIYPVDDTNRVLDMLSKTLPVRVRSVTRYWVSIDAHA